MSQKINIPNVFDKKDLEHKLHVQHKNDRYDAINIINSYFSELEKENEIVKDKFTTHPLVLNGKIVAQGSFNHYGYLNYKKYPDANELTRRIMNMKQRKPKQEE